MQEKENCWSHRWTRASVLCKASRLSLLFLSLPSMQHGFERCKDLYRPYVCDSVLFKTKNALAM